MTRSGLRALAADLGKELGLGAEIIQNRELIFACESYDDT